MANHTIKRDVPIFCHTLAFYKIILKSSRVMVMARSCDVNGGHTNLWKVIIFSRFHQKYTLQQCYLNKYMVTRIKIESYMKVDT